MMHAGPIGRRRRRGPLRLSGLVADWWLGESIGGQIIDRGGNALHAAIVGSGGTFQAGGLAFPGDSAYYLDLSSHAAAFAAMAAWSVDFWILAVATGAAQYVLALVGADPADAYIITMDPGAEPDSRCGIIKDSSLAGLQLDMDIWGFPAGLHHVCFVSEGTEESQSNAAYLDGQPGSLVYFTGSAGTAATPNTVMALSAVTIGERKASDGTPLASRLYRLRIHNRPLADGDVLELYQAGIFG